LNAAKFISNFMASDMPDTSWFLKVVDDLIVAARKGRKEEDLRIAACGECAHIIVGAMKGRRCDSTRKTLGPNS